MSNARNLAVLAVQQLAFKNKILNGAFDVWQRGTSFDGTFGRGTYWGPDRWQVYRGGGAVGGTFSRIAYNGPNALYALRMQRDAGNTGTASLALATSLESTDVLMLKGKTVTLSFRYLTGANFSGGQFNVSANYGTGTDGSLAAGFTNGAAVPGSGVAYPASSTQAYVSQTFTVPANASQFGLVFGFNPTGTAGANDYVEITNIQLEIGGAATSYEYVPYPVQLLACQRYYERSFVRVDTPLNSAAVYGNALLSYKATKRVVPTLTRVGEAVSNCTFNSYQHDQNVCSVIYNTSGSVGSATFNLAADAEL